MKKILILTLLSLTSLLAKEYMAKIEPYEKYKIKAKVSGAVTKALKSDEYSYIKEKELLIKLDSKDEEIELKGQKNLLHTENEIVKIKKSNFSLKNRIKLLSTYDKNSENLSYLEAKKELLNIKNKIESLENTISKKSYFVQDKYVGEILVNKDEYINIGDILFYMYDISKLKLTLFLSRKEIDNLNTQALYIDGKVSDFKIDKISKIKDETNISRYKVEFVKENKNLDKFFFNELVKIKIK